MALLHHEIYGRRGHPPVVFVHGFLGSGADWRPVVDGLRDTYCCVTVDLPGHGGSVGRGADGYTLEAATAGLRAVCDHLGLERSALVGYSMGGRVALCTAAETPARWRGLLVESASPGLATEADRAARRKIDADRAARLAADLPGFLDAWAAMPLFATLRRHPDRLATLQERRRKGDPAELARALEGLSVGRQPSLWPRLAALPDPFRVIAGTEDPKYADIACRIARAHEPARPVFVLGAGHNVHLEKPAAYLHVVRRFLAACTPP